MKLSRIFIPLLFCAALSATSTLAEDYEYPINNGIAATVIGTPKEFAAELPDVRRYRSDRTLKYDKSRKIPEIYWHSKGLQYSLVSQDGPAPLLISIAGTGGSSRTDKLRAIESAFYGQGFHILSLPSPTHANFIVNSSTSRLPGLPEDDARDLYRVIKEVVKDVSAQTEITEFHLIGYSLGGTQAAFVAKIDKEKGVFNFRRVLMINPAVNLYNSVTIFDKMFERRFPDAVEFRKFFNKVIHGFARIMHEEDFVGLSSHALYQAYRDRSPSDRDLEGLIAFTFRLSLANMLFAADVMSDSGYIVPAGYEIPKHASMTTLYKVSVRQSFRDYFERMVYPRYRERFPTQKDFIDASSLRSISPFLKNSRHIGVMTNANDPIYAQGQVEFLRQTFGERATVFPNGGHLGNLRSRGFIYRMLSFFEESRS